MKLDEITQQPAFDKQAILAELAKLGIEPISTINADGSVDVNGDVRIPNSYTEIPVQFRNVSGSFNCSNTGILSLQYAPQQVGSNFYCNNTLITSLQYAPQRVGGDFYCRNTKITSLQGAPHYVGNGFFCNSTEITSLRYAPQQVSGIFFCHDTLITSLHNIHKTNSDWVIGDKLVVPDNCTHILGLAFIQGVKVVNVRGYELPINHRDPFEWQEQLIELGLVEQAQL